MVLRQPDIIHMLCHSLPLIVWQALDRQRHFLKQSRIVLVHVLVESSFIVQGRHLALRLVSPRRLLAILFFILGRSALVQRESLSHFGRTCLLID